MLRFINLDNQIARGSKEFAWFDTVTDKFQEFNGTHVWNSWSEFVEDYDGEDLDRYKELYFD